MYKLETDATKNQKIDLPPKYQNTEQFTYQHLYNLRTYKGFFENLDN